MLMHSPLGRMARQLLLHAALVLLVGAAPGLASELRVERTLLPDASPSSFAIGFPNGTSLCYDVTRGGLSYIWRGGFVDLSSVRPEAGKVISAVKLLGDVVYREHEYFPLRRGDSERAAPARFKGYRLHDGAIEFVYEVDQCRVREEIRPLEDGIVRRFQIEGAAADETWWYIPGGTQGANLHAPVGHREAGGFRFKANEGLVLEVRFEGAES